jgi:phosphopantothenoylcysteine decarboxylase/phosphopantothenate--cysteine ligase
MLSEGDLKGLNILITAGPTEEPLDPVRYLTNRSSGKMGVSLAKRAAARGANVTFISGPIRVAPPESSQWVQIRTAEQMRQAVLERAGDSDIVVMAAAVADFKPDMINEHKIKKTGEALSLKLVPNPDIIGELGANKRPGQILVGFAAETDNAVENARKKLLAKNVDMLALNDVSKPGAGFDGDTNIIRLLFKDREDEQFEIMTKDQVADIILDRVLEMRPKQ